MSLLPSQYFREFNLIQHLTIFCSDFDLEAHIASLPAVNINFKKNASRQKHLKLKVRHHSESSALMARKESSTLGNPARHSSLKSPVTPLQSPTGLYASCIKT